MSTISLGRPPEDAFEKYREAFECFSNPSSFQNLSDDDFENHRTHNAKAALDNPVACQRMSPAQFEASLREFPWDAIKNEHSCRRMNDRQFDWAIRKMSWPALKYLHAFSRLTIEQRLFCLSKEPFSPIVLPHVSDIADSEILDSKIFRYPDIAMENSWIFRRVSLEAIIRFANKHRTASGIPEIVEILSERSFLRGVR